MPSTLPVHVGLLRLQHYYVTLLGSTRRCVRYGSNSNFVASILIGD